MTHTSWFGIELSDFYGVMLNGITRQTRCQHRARDILHDALVRYAVVASRDQIDAPRAYLQRIIGSVIADHYRHEARYVPLPQDDGDSSSADIQALHRPDAVPTPEEITDMRLRLARLQAVLQTLPPKCREVFWLLRVEGLDHETIADRLGISRKTVEGHVTRALVKLVHLRRTCDVFR